MTENEAKWEYCRAIDLIKRIKTEETHERYIDRHKAFDLAIQALEKVQKFEAIGTVEEFKALKEKNEQKKATWKFDDFTAKFGNPYRCSNCNEEYGDTYNYCPNCGCSMHD